MIVRARRIVGMTVTTILGLFIAGVLFFVIVLWLEWPWIKYEWRKRQR